MQKEKDCFTLSIVTSINIISDPWITIHAWPNQQKTGCRTGKRSEGRRKDQEQHNRKMERERERESRKEDFENDPMEPDDDDLRWRGSRKFLAAALHPATGWCGSWSWWWSWGDKSSLSLSLSLLLIFVFSLLFCLRSTFRASFCTIFASSHSLFLSFYLLVPEPIWKPVFASAEERKREGRKKEDDLSSLFVGPLLFLWLETHSLSSLLLFTNFTKLFMAIV